jgi:DNA-binding NarL/FixJ family response regulator
LKVVLIDASPRVRADLRQLLAVFPRIEISEAVDGLRGLALVRDTRPALILLDLEVEGLGVEELLRSIRIENPGTRAVVLSGRSGSPCAKRALSAGAAGYVRKAASSHERLRTVRRVAEVGVILRLR